MNGDEEKERIIRAVAEQLGVSEDKGDWPESMAVDSLDVQELVLELEEEFGDDLK